MYEAFYGLRERPFDLTPNPRFLLMTPGHREALSTVQYGISGRKGLTLLVGAAGTGKTTVVRAALERQQGENAQAIYLTNPVISRDEFFDWLAEALGVEQSRSKPKFLHELRANLVARHAAGIDTALIIDEAQAMPDELLEEVRLLENLETESEKLLPVVLVGQMELAERLKQPALQPLKQRVALRSTLLPLSAQETGTYVAERIRIAGGDIRSIFKPEAVAAICESSGGIPRVISVVCDNALVSGFALDQRPVGVPIVAEVCRDFDLPIPRVAASTEGFVAAAVALTPQPAAADSALAIVPPPAIVHPPAAATPPGALSNLQMPDVVPVSELVVDMSEEPPAPRPSPLERVRALGSKLAKVAQR